MEIGFVNTDFQAIDRTPYERWEDVDNEHVILQRLIDSEGSIIDSVKISIAHNADELRNPFIKSGIDLGLFYYQKLIIPSEDHAGSGIEKVYYDSDGIIHFVDIDEGIDTELNPTTQYDDIYDLIRKYAPENCFYFDDYAFSIYALVECYVLMEKERIDNYLKNNCRVSCSDNALELNNKVDILLAAVTVLRNLIEKKDFFEAQRILNGLNTCNGLCKKYSNSINGCGCGKS